ncbi:60S ribosomal protein L4-1 [Linum grandiflorum]
MVKAFRNIPGLEVANVKRLNLLKLAPGGHLGRFVVWTKSAFEKLDSIYGSFEKSSKKKNGYVLHRAKMVNDDLARIINSDEVHSVVKPVKKEVKRATLNPKPSSSTASSPSKPAGLHLAGIHILCIALVLMSLDKK